MNHIMVSAQKIIFFILEYKSSFYSNRSTASKKQPTTSDLKKASEIRGKTNFRAIYTGQ